MNKASKRKAKIAKPEVHRIWVPSTSSVGTSKYVNFVRKADYDKLAKLIQETL